MLSKGDLVRINDQKIKEFIAQEPFIANLNFVACGIVWALGNIDRTLEIVSTARWQSKTFSNPRWQDQNVDFYYYFLEGTGFAVTEHYVDLVFSK